MKKNIFILLFIFIMVFSCSKTENNQSSDNELIKIGIIQLVEHPALDQAYQGFVDGLKEAGYEEGKNVSFDYQNAQGEQANCITIAQKFLNDKSDLILAIATPAAQAAANLIKDIPILVTAVTDPETAKLVEKNDAPKGNVSGTSNLTPVDEQMELLKKLVPNVKTVALMYNSSEQNSKFQIDMAKRKLDEMGISYIEATVTNPNDIQQVVQSIIGKAEAVYIPTDNMLASGMANVISVTEPAKIPVICGEVDMLKSGGLATYGISHYELGKLTSKQAVRILKGEASTATMPIEYLQTPTLSINTNAAQKLGITIPADLQ
ncbi:ABC transporter substrate-binding protein [uncultured Brachyspira sp.]|uniref:ABC transporter substrate-binding protein n=1 Tax=uncultured Brachyspira sp. TaxID=221953 RepID=UPI0026345CB5|nr:ABC transporter substrate-binding protein [uncultured Brachyspira sp.]